MNEQMMQQTDDRNYRLTWRGGKNRGMAEVRWTGQIHRYVGRVEKGSEESHVLLKTLDQPRCIRDHTDTCCLSLCCLTLVSFLVHPTVLDGDFRTRRLIFQVSFNASRFTQ